MNRCTRRALARNPSPQPGKVPIIWGAIARGRRVSLAGSLALGIALMAPATSVWAQTSSPTTTSPAGAPSSAPTAAAAAAEKALQELLEREALARQNAALPQLGSRRFPASAMRGFMEVLAPPALIVNGTPERLSPGHRIRGPNNMLVMSGQLAGQKLVVNYVRNQQGELHEVWILTAREAQEEREGSGPVRNFRFESEPAEAKKLP